MRSKVSTSSQNMGLHAFFAASLMNIKENVVDAMAVLWLAQGVGLASDGMADPDGGPLLFSGGLCVLAGFFLYPLKSIAAELERRFHAAMEKGAEELTSENATRKTPNECRLEALRAILVTKKRGVYVLVCIMLCGISLYSAGHVLRQHARASSTDPPQMLQQAIGPLETKIMALEQHIEDVSSTISLELEQNRNEHSDRLRAMMTANNAFADEVGRTDRQTAESIARLHEAISGLQETQNNISARLDEMARVASSGDVSAGK